MENPVKFLKYLDGAGRQLVLELPSRPSSSVCYLPDLVEERINLFDHPTEINSTVRLDLEDNYVLLSVWTKTPTPSYILDNGGAKIYLPLSTPEHQKSVILSNKSRFFTSAGSWILVFDDRHEPTCSSAAFYGLLDEEVHKQTESRDLDESNTVASTSVIGTQQTTSYKDCEPTAVWGERPIHQHSRATDISTMDDEKATEENRQCLSRSHLPMQTVVQANTTSTSAGSSQNEEVDIRDASKRPISAESLPLNDIHPLFDATRKRKSPQKSYSHRKRTMLNYESTDRYQVTNTEQQLRVDEPSSSTHAINLSTQTQEDQVASKLSQDQSEFSPRTLRTRSMPGLGANTALNNGSLLAVVFSSNCSVQDKKAIMTAFRDRGGRVVDSVNEADIVCVPKGPLKKTSKFVLAVILAKPIVTENWMLECHKQRRWLKCSKFLPKDDEREREWGIQLGEVVNAKSENNLRTRLLSGTDVYLTPQLSKELGKLVTELHEIAKAMSASDLRTKLPTEKEVSQGDVLVLGCVNDTGTLAVKKLGLILYKKDLLTIGGLRGHLDFDSEEFRVPMYHKAE